jgi:AcrR family transcriptional regulator
LIEAALELLERHGSDGVTLREAARIAGVTHAAPYRHFADKTALLAAAALEGARGMLDRMMMARADADPLSRLQALGVAYVTYAVEHPSYFRLMYGKDLDSASDELKTVKHQKLSLLLETVAAAQRAGQLPGDDPKPVALTAWSLVHGLATLLIEGAPQRSGLGGDDAAAIARAVTASGLNRAASGVRAAGVTRDAAAPRARARRGKRP